MRKWIALAAGFAILGAANHAIYKREQLITEGRVVLLELAPVDPRSLMQGDYMALAFTVSDQAFGRGATQRTDGRIVVKLDERGVARFDRFDDGGPLAAHEQRLRYRIRDARAKFATNAYFFQEGTAHRYVAARFGEFRVARDGEAILTGLRGKDLEPLH